MATEGSFSWIPPHSSTVLLHSELFNASTELISLTENNTRIRYCKVERVLDRREFFQDGQTISEYMVQWEGASGTETTWELPENIVKSRFTDGTLYVAFPRLRPTEDLGFRSADPEGAEEIMGHPPSHYSYVPHVSDVPFDFSNFRPLGEIEGGKRKRSLDPEGIEETALKPRPTSPENNISDHLAPIQTRGEDMHAAHIDGSQSSSGKRRRTGPPEWLFLENADFVKDSISFDSLLPTRQTHTRLSPPSTSSADQSNPTPGNDPGSGQQMYYYHPAPRDESLYYCPFAGTDGCMHEPTRFEANYVRYVTFHLRASNLSTWRCLRSECSGLQFSTIDDSLRHERDVHNVYKCEKRKEILCDYPWCYHFRPGQGFSVSFAHILHMKRDHAWFEPDKREEKKHHNASANNDSEPPAEKDGDEVRYQDGMQPEVSSFSQVQPWTTAGNEPPVQVAGRQNDECGKTRVQEVKDTLTSQPVPSDSGYHSGIGTDTESVCSMSSVGSSLGLPTDFLQEFISLFGDLLMEKSGARYWALPTLEQYQPVAIEQGLKNLLKTYALELSSEMEKHQAGQKERKIAMDATRLIRRYRPKIANYFCTNVIAASNRVGDMELRLQGLGKMLSLPERVGLLDKWNHDEPEEEVEEDDDDNQEIPFDLTPIKQFLLAGEPFRRLIVSMRRALYCDDESQLEKISNVIRQSLSPANPTGTQKSSYKAMFNVEWNILGFLQSQYEECTPPLAKILTVSGSALYAHATTCSDYLQTIWPRTGIFLLNVLQEAVDKIDPTIPAEQRSSITAIHRDLKLEIDLIGNEGAIPSSGSLSITAFGTSEILVELAQQLAWIGAALRSSTIDDQVAYVNAHVVESGVTVEGSHFDVLFNVEPLHKAENPCWLPLFSNVVIARGFPIPERQEEMGLEMRVDIMAGIAGVRHAVEYEGGVVMKGISTMLVPMKRTEDRIQWHLISTVDREARLSYRDGVDRLPARAKCDEVGLDHLQTTRAFIGWCSTTITTLGHDSANYENIDYSGADDSESSLKISGGTIGFQQFGVAQLDYALGAKDGKCHFQRKGPYRNIVSIAERTPIVLYDTTEKRAWLVPASSVILHVVQNRHWLEPFEVGGKLIQGFLSHSLGEPARKVLFKNASVALSDEDDDNLRDMTTNIWSVLEYLLDQNVRRDNAVGIPINSDLRDILRGFEFKAVVEEKSPYRAKQCYIEKTSGGWARLVKDIDALVLFASGFEDLIRPTDEHHGLCHIWRRVPKWKDYLATTVGILKGLYNVAGCRLTHDYLTSTRLQWHRGKSMLFESCRSPGAYQCQCNRLQQIVPKSAFGSVIPPGPLANDKSGVIFGQSAMIIRKVDFTKPCQTASFYSQPNVHLKTATPDQNYQETLVPVISESEQSYQSSDLSDANQPSSATSYSSQTRLEAPVENVKFYSNACPSPQKRFWSEESESEEERDFQPTPIFGNHKRPRLGGHPTSRL